MAQVEQQMPAINLETKPNVDITPFRMVEDPRYLPKFPKADSLLINSGNVVSSERLKKRSTANPQDEVEEVLNNTLACWLGSVEEENFSELKTIECRHPKYYCKLDATEKDDVSITIKLFLNTADTALLTRAITKILNEVGADQIDTLIVSMPEKLFKQGELSKELFLPLWQTIQQEISDKRVINVGLSDFNAEYLTQVVNYVEDKSQLPYLNQVNITSCCKMPDELVEVTKIHNIKLTTHIDPIEILTVDSLQTTIRKYSHEYDAQGWEHLWVARYTLILKGRGIVQSKGYIFDCQRESRYTK